MADLWRVGSKVGRTIYLNDKLVGMMDTIALAKKVVDALNMSYGSTPVVEVPAEPIPSPISPLTRISASSGKYVSHAYSTKVPWNKPHTAMALKHAGGYMAIHEGNGKFYMMLPDRVKHDSELVWSLTDPNLFYGTSGRVLWKFDIGKSWDTQPVTIRVFDEYDRVSIGVGEGDISEDGDYIPMCGDGINAFLYRISTNTTGPVYQVQGLNAVYVSPDNNLIVTGPGIHIVKDGRLNQIVPNFGHMDVGRDLDGREMILWSNNENNSITKIRLNNPTARIPLLTLHWDLATHICMPAGQPYAIVSPYCPKGADVLYGDSILKLPLNGDKPIVVANHHTDVTTGTNIERYEGQPKACGSDGKLVFNSREKGEIVVYVGQL